MYQSDEFAILKKEEIPDGIPVTWGPCNFWFVRDSGQDLHTGGWSGAPTKITDEERKRMPTWRSNIPETFVVRISDIEPPDDNDLWE